MRRRKCTLKGGERARRRGVNKNEGEDCRKKKKTEVIEKRYGFVAH